MCGIAAALGFVDDRVIDGVRAMNQAQVHRGPDDEGLWVSDGIVLAHRRLAVIDLSPQGHQPMKDEDTGAVIVYNGEAYNYPDLRMELDRFGHRFRSHTDTEVVLKAYIEWGPGCVDRLRGMYAFLIWDPRTRRAFMARDRLGIKPLYFFLVDHGGGRRTLLLASEIRALLASGFVERRLDPTSLATFVWNGFVQGPQAIIRGVRIFGSGNRATVSLEDLDVVEESYWNLPAHQPRDLGVEEVREALSEATRIRLVSDVPLGIFLSGGIDSSAVAAMAAHTANDSVRTFTVGFGEAQYDESRYAQAVARALGTQHERLSLTQDHFEAELPAALDSIDQPTFDQINTYFVSRVVREAGITVALAGVGGDELFGGYSSFRDIPRAARWARVARHLPLGVLRRMAAVAAAIKYGARGQAGAQVRWAKLGDVLATRGDLVGLYQVVYALFTRDFYDQLLADEIPEGVGFGLSAPRRGELAGLVSGEPELHALSMLEVACFLGERLLRDCDAASMSVSLELRVPLLDHSVVELLSAIAMRTRFEPVGRKQLLRKSALGSLPPSLFDRPKAGFVLPLEVWLRQSLKERVELTLTDRALCESVGLCPKAVGRLWQDYSSGAQGLYWSRVWALYVLLWWCKRHGVTA